MEHAWSGKRILITAGASGIGLAIAEAFYAGGASIWICDIDSTALSAAKQRMPRVETMVCDVADPDQVIGFVDAAADALGGLDFVINNAGISGPAAPVEAITPAQWQQVMAVNLNGQFYVAHAAVPHLKRSGGGAMICMSSVAGKYAFALRSPYAASKAAVIALARGLSVELGPFNIRVNAVAPGVVEGDRINRVLSDRAKAKGISFEEMQEVALRAVSLKTMVSASEIAALVLFLCAPTGRAITGQVLSLCGGLEYAE